MFIYDFHLIIIKFCIIIMLNIIHNFDITLTKRLNIIVDEMKMNDMTTGDDPNKILDLLKTVLLDQQDELIKMMKSAKKGKNMHGYFNNHLTGAIEYILSLSGGKGNASAFVQYAVISLLTDKFGLSSISAIRNILPNIDHIPQNMVDVLEGFLDHGVKTNLLVNLGDEYLIRDEYDQLVTKNLKKAGDYFMVGKVRVEMGTDGIIRAIQELQ